MKTSKTYYITTSALTLSILPATELKDQRGRYPAMKFFEFEDMSGRKKRSLKIGRDVYDTFEEALDRAEKLRSRKIVSLKKQIEKIQNMNFKQMFKERK